MNGTPFLIPKRNILILRFYSFLFCLVLNCKINEWMNEKKWKMYWQFSARTLSSNFMDISINPKTQRSKEQNKKYK